ncbi:hypothetical protein LSH36_446g02072 [Paralvinella palmiformis]|uniref:PDEase domain-containing protein n=1 Tax=Paralvinella palmiformis TaxID=53620 RepID=A0AAD9JBK2_9ANNE|nr:hypothetical protein LSH36_446g02072 [Paralvinella palmiformis]
MMSLYRFTLTVRKNYRHVPYHNWEHAFSVAHAMFTIIKTTEHVFTPLECLCLFVACVCHDVDHRGYTNSFLKESSSPLAAIYTTSTMEHHHFNRTITILQNDGHNIFKHLSSEEYKQVLGDIRHCILATDLALFFGNRAKLKDIVDGGNFNWQNKEHKEMLMAASMTACDLCSMYKPWELQVELVNIIMEEFWQQGDEEKRHGNTPIPMMDRDKADELPNSQGDKEKLSGITPIPMMDRARQDELPKLEVGFIVGICLPCYELMTQVLPKTQPMVDGARANLERWQELADKQKAIEEQRAIEDKERQQTT